MELHVFNPYIVGLSRDLVECLQVRSQENVCFAVTRDSKNIPTELWIGKETIFSSMQGLSYPLHSHHYCGFDGFSARQLVYDLNLNPGVYKVNETPVFSPQNGIDWFKVEFTYVTKRNWSAIHSCSIRKYKKINLNDDTLI